MINECIDIEDLELMDLFPRWAYHKHEWNQIVSDTVRKVDGMRYKEKEPEQKEMERVENELNSFVDCLI